MPVKKIITSVAPNTHTPHYFQTKEAFEVLRLVFELSRTYKDRILCYEKFKDQTTVITKTTYESREISDRFDEIVYQTFPNYVAARNAYNQANGITWTVTYEEV